MSCESCPGVRLPLNQNESLQTGAWIELLKAIEHYKLELTVCGLTGQAGKEDLAKDCNSKIRDSLLKAVALASDDED
jgi:hypothetical protein